MHLGGANKLKTNLLLMSFQHLYFKRTKTNCQGAGQIKKKTVFDEFRPFLFIKDLKTVKGLNNVKTMFDEVLSFVCKKMRNNCHGA